ncbi:MAG: hypothetical protein COB66_01475 [Coxiella sp. (in: Bacteria)]|nr:MAG: hypothetical protein COB66_01475 [Coxiella sp. (in: g-proteobacteria)]
MAKKKTLLGALGGTPESKNTLPATFREDSASANSAVSAEEAIQEVGADSEQIQELAKQELDFLAALLMPLIVTYGYPPVFQEIYRWLIDFSDKKRTFPQLAIGLPRGFGKTTLMKIYIIYCILFTDAKFILVISSTASLAENILADIVDMLEEPNIKSVFGDWKLGVEKDTQKLKKFGFRGRNIILAAIGAGSSLRGLNIKNQRPDVMLFEDFQTKEASESDVESHKLETWMVGTAMKAKSPHGCVFIFVANMYPNKNSILRKLKQNPNWIKFIAGGINSEGESLWEELQPITQLLKEFENDLAMGHPEIFYSEVLNDENVSANNLIDLSKLPTVPYEAGDIAGGNFIIIDPSSDKLGSDAVSIGYFEIHDAKPILMELEEGRFSPGDTILKALGFALKHNCRLIVCEGTAFQYSLIYWFDQICLQKGIMGIEAVPIYPGISSKNSRILTMFKSYAAGELYCIGDARLALHLQITQFNPLRRDNTDGILDLMTYAPRVLLEFGEYVIAGSIIEAQEYEGMEVEEFNSAF